jgi:2-methylcitrate dehydratase PrpD
MDMDQDLVHHFAHAAAATTYDRLSDTARERVKQSLLDTLGVSLAASGLEPAVSAAQAIVRENGGAEQATLWAFGGRAPAAWAAFANGALVHGLDYDDLTPWGQHCGSTIIPSVFAMAERQGGVSGKDLIAAVAVGQDLFARLLRYTGWKKDWNFSTAMGIFAGTAAAGRIMGLDAPRIAAALGIATLQAGGVMEMVAGHGSDLRGLYAGFSAKGAVLSALMAEQGVSGIDRAFEGPNGVFACYFAGRYDRAAMLDGLGADYLGATTLYKRWPCVGTAHSHMKAAIDIVSQAGLSPDDIASVTLHTGDYHLLMSEPLEERIAPKTLADAKFSLPFLVATAILRRGMSVRDFSPGTLADPQVRALAGKMRLQPDSSLDWNGALPPGRVEIETHDGQHWQREGHGVPGNADNPMGWEDIRAKFRECCSVAAKPPSEDRMARAEGLVMRIEELADGTELIRCLME